MLCDRISLLQNKIEREEKEVARRVNINMDAVAMMQSAGNSSPSQARDEGGVDIFHR